ncbi:MAG: DUF6933 domain-containing protein [Gammaproteobacteria bacterium]
MDPSASRAGWHANLLWFERRKCVLFTHDETLYSVWSGYRGAGVSQHPSKPIPNARARTIPVKQNAR